MDRRLAASADDLLQIAMNVECQTIRVPTGVQDYRPALYGGIAAVELAVDGDSPRRRSTSTRRSSKSRIVLAYTGAPRNSGTNNWEITKRHLDGDAHVFDCFERIRDTAVAMRAALEARTTGTRSAGTSRPSGTTGNGWRPASRRRRSRTSLRAPPRPGATAAKVCGAGGGGCLFCYGPPAVRRRSPRLWLRWRRARARLPHRAGRPSRWITARSRAFLVRSPISSRSRATTRSRFARTGTAPISSPTIRTSCDARRRRTCAKSPGIGKDLASRIREIPRPGRARITPSSSRNFRQASWISCTCRASARRRSPPLYRELGVRTLDDLEQAARSGRVRAIKGMGAKKESADPQVARRAQTLRRPPPLCAHARRGRQRSSPLLKRPHPARPSRPSAACGGDAKPAATSTSSRLGGGTCV